MQQREYQNQVEKALRYFWKMRASQHKRQGNKTGHKDAGNRAAVTGGGHLNGFITFIVGLINSAGIATPDILYKGQGSTILPGFYRATKDWDLVVVSNQQLIACIELKSQVGSFGNNFNNRTEEALGNATDFWTAYREGAFAGCPRPFLGYLMILEDSEKSTSPVRVQEPHFPVFPEFKDASYAIRYEQLCLKLIRERLYDGTCFITSPRPPSRTVKYTEPNAEIGIHRFASALVAHVGAYAQR